MACSVCGHEDTVGEDCKGCRYQCVTCGLHLYGKDEVCGHFFFFRYLHRYYRDTKTGKLYHHTDKGLSAELPPVVSETV